MIDKSGPKLCRRIRSKLGFHCIGNIFASLCMTWRRIDSFGCEDSLGWWTPSFRFDIKWFRFSPWAFYFLHIFVELRSWYTFHEHSLTFSIFYQIILTPMMRMSCEFHGVNLHKRSFFLWWWFCVFEMRLFQDLALS